MIEMKTGRGIARGIVGEENGAKARALRGVAGNKKGVARYIHP